MRALTFGGLRSIRLETLDDPGLAAPTDALVRVELAAICGSDLHVYHGRERGCDPGTVMGHEFVGEVVETGREVRGLSAGARVLSPFSTSCGECFYCARGLTARCATGQLYGWVEGGHGLDGAQAEYVRVPLASSTLVPLPPEVSAEEGLLLGDVLSTGYHCAESARFEPGAVVAVVGCGPVGLMAVVGACDLEASSVLAIDRIPERLALAARFGARTVDLGVEDPVQAVLEATDGRGADAVLEAVGSPEASRLAFGLLRPGGTLSVAGVHNEERFAFTPAMAYTRNLTFRTGRCPARRMIDRLLPLLCQRRFDLSGVVTHRLPLDQGVAAYDTFDRKEDGCIKVVLRP